MSTVNSSAVRETLGRMQVCQFRDAASGLPALLLIHGWASSSNIWVNLLPQLSKKFDIYTLDLPGTNTNEFVDCKDVSDFLDIYSRDVHPLLPSKYAVLGWSLGGGLASLIAERFADNVFALVTVATNPQFVATEHWPYAMARKTFQLFERNLEKNQSKTIGRFAVLQTQQTVSSKDDLRWLKGDHAAARHSPVALRRGLQWLEALMLQDCWLNLTMPVLHQYGRLDQLVPVELVARLNIESCNKAQIKIFEQSAHLPFASESKAWLHAVEGFLVQQSSEPFSKEGVINQTVKSLDKQAVAQAFSKAAAHYDERANFQHEVGHNLLSAMQTSVSGQLNRVLDLGSGTGYFAKALHNICTVEHMVEMDIAMGMLTHSQAKKNDAVQVRADIEALPFASGVFDLVFANLAIQWCQSYSELMLAVFQSLSGRGVLAFTTILNGSLCELKSAWKKVDNEPHINAFVSEHLVQAAVQETGFQVASWKVIRHKQYFTDKRSLLNSVKGIGAGNHLAGRKNALTTKAKYRQFMAALDEQQDSQGRYCLTYNVLYSVLKKR